MKTLLVVIVLSVFSLLIIQPGSVEGSGLCGFLPCDKAAFCPEDGSCNEPLSAVGELVRLGTGLIFVSLIIYGIWLIVKAALRIIRSEGDPAKIQEGSGLIRAAMIGIGIIFVGLIGLVIVFVFFDSTSLFRVTPEDPDLIDLPVL